MQHRKSKLKHDRDSLIRLDASKALVLRYLQPPGPLIRSLLALEEWQPVRLLRLAVFLEGRYEMRSLRRLLLLFAPLLLTAGPAAADLLYSNGPPDAREGIATRPGIGPVVENEAADDFILHGFSSVTSATFTGILVSPTGAVLTPADVGQVDVEIYHVFPKDSDTSRTPNVPTRANSPSDVNFVGRGTNTGDLTFTTLLPNGAAPFTVTNSVIDGIHPVPNQTTGGEGPQSGTEVQFNVTFTNPIPLTADHYFFVPQVQVNGGNFLWLSAPGPPAFTGDLQSWIRNANLDPDWLRVGTDIIGGSPAPRFDQSFSITGTAPVPEPSSLALLGTGLLPVVWGIRRRLRRA